MSPKTQILKIDPGSINSDKIELIARVLHQNGVIAYPTDTFYGLGVKCYAPDAVSRIHRIKKRKGLKPLPIIIADINSVEILATEIPAIFWIIAKKFWPGPLTLVLKASSRLPEELLASSGKVGVRVPDMEWLRALIRRTKFPITATSANISGEGEVIRVNRVIDIFNGQVDLIVDGGKTPGTKPSTLVDLTSERPKVIREGAIPGTMLKGFWET